MLMIVLCSLSDSKFPQVLKILLNILVGLKSDLYGFDPSSDLQFL